MSYATEIQFTSSTATNQGNYRAGLAFEEFVRMANSQLNPDIAPDYGCLVMDNSCRYAATDGDIIVEYREQLSILDGSAWGWWSVRDQWGLGGGGENIDAALREWHAGWLDRRMGWLDQSMQPED